LHLSRSQSEAADDLHSGIQHRDLPERGGEGILAASYSANGPGGGVSFSNYGTSVSSRWFVHSRTTIEDRS